VDAPHDETPNDVQRETLHSLRDSILALIGQEMADDLTRRDKPVLSPIKSYRFGSKIRQSGTLPASK
jgi:hypothetical protein